jgi:hypothetical protein
VGRLERRPSKIIPAILDGSAFHISAKNCGT